MSDATDQFDDRADEEALIHAVSDEALEAAGARGRAAATYNWLTSFHYACC